MPGILGGNKNMVLEFIERRATSINKVDKESLDRYGFVQFDSFIFMENKLSLAI